METMRDPFFASRVNVVMFREPWGKTPWTGIEQTAITERCLESGWEALMFVQLDDSSQIPKWLPKTNVRFALASYGLEQLAGAVKARVQEQGGVLKPLDPMTEARRIKRKADYYKDREELMRDRQWIEAQVHQNIRTAFARVHEMVSEINSEHDLQIDIGKANYQSCVMRCGYVSLGIWWEQPIYNSVVNDRNGECYLRVAEFSGPLVIPGRNERMWCHPQQLKEYRFMPDVAETRDLVWKLGSERIAHDELTKRIVLILMGLIDRMNAGKVPRPN